MTKARLVVTSPLIIGGVKLQPGELFAELDFPTPQHAAFFAANLRWSAMTVQVDGDTSVIPTATKLSEVATLADDAAALAAAGIASLGDLVAASPKALRNVEGIGDRAGSLIRAAKRALNGEPEPRQPKQAPLEDEPADETDPAAVPLNTFREVPVDEKKKGGGVPLPKTPKSGGRKGSKK